MFRVLISKQNFISWLFGLDRWKKCLLQMVFDSLVAPIAFLIASFMRYETFDYLYRIDTYIGILIATATTFVVFASLGIYNNVARYISNDTIFSIALASVVSCAILFFSIFLAFGRGEWTSGRF